MARKRMISPEIWGDPSFNKFSIPARLLFIGMVSNADDEGYLRGDARNLKRMVFGNDDYTSTDVQQLADELKKFQNLHFFESNDEEYVHFVKWDVYQKQQKDRIQPSAYPMCSICAADDKQMLTEVKLSKDKLSKLNTSRNKNSAGGKSFKEKFLNKLSLPSKIRSSKELLATEIYEWSGQKLNFGMLMKLIKTKGEQFCRESWADVKQSDAKEPYKLFMHKLGEVKIKLS